VIFCLDFFSPSPFFLPIFFCSRKATDQSVIPRMSTFLLLIKTIWCDHSLESSLRDDSNEWSHHMVWLRFKRIMTKNVSIVRFQLHSWSHENKLSVTSGEDGRVIRLAILLLSMIALKFSTPILTGNNLVLLRLIPNLYCISCHKLFSAHNEVHRQIPQI